MKRILEYRFFKIINCVGDCNIVYIVILIRYLESAVNEFIDINNFEWSGGTVRNGFVNRRTDNSINVVIVIVFSIIGAKIDGIIIICRTDFRTVKNFTGFSVKNGIGESMTNLVIKTNKIIFTFN